MKKMISFIAALSICGSVSAEIATSNVYFSNYSPGIIKVYGVGIPYYEMILPGKSGKAYVQTISQMNPMDYRIVTESGIPLNFTLKGHERECRTRYAYVEYSSEDDKPGKAEFKSSLCNPNTP